MRVRPQLLLLFALASMTGQAAAAVPSLESPELARGPYAEMHTLLEKTIANIDVMRVDVRLGDHTRDRLTELIAHRTYSPSLAARVAGIIIDTDNAVVQLEFKCDVAFDQWRDAVQKDLQRAKSAGLIDEQSYRYTSTHLPLWFASIEQRGFQDGDRLLYRVRPSSLRTVLVSRTGQVLLDQTDSGKQPARVLLAGIFAPGSDLREPLIRSLFER